MCRVAILSACTKTTSCMVDKVELLQKHVARPTDNGLLDFAGDVDMCATILPINVNSPSVKISLLLRISKAMRVLDLYYIYTSWYSFHLMQSSAITLFISTSKFTSV